MRYQNLLYAIDLDANHSGSLIYAMEFARIFESRLHILYINDQQAGYRHPADHEDAVALKVKDTVPETLRENTDIVYTVAKGDTAKEILKYAQANKIDLIIVGHKHRGKLFSSFFDSTDVNLIDETLTPVLVIPEK